LENKHSKKYIRWVSVKKDTHKGVHIAFRNRNKFDDKTSKKMKINKNKYENTSDNLNTVVQTIGN